MNKIEIHITEKCNGKCFNCSNLAGIAPSITELKIEDIIRFIDESIELNYIWDSIVLHGGEPTLHPDIDEICKLFHMYKIKYAPSTKLLIATNGYGMALNVCDRIQKYNLFLARHTTNILYSHLYF